MNIEVQLDFELIYYDGSDHHAKFDFPGTSFVYHLY